MSGTPPVQFMSDWHTGSIVQSARPVVAGNLVSDRYYDHFGRVLWQFGPPLEVGYRSMNSIQGLDSLPAWQRPLMMTARCETHIGPRLGQESGVLFHVPNTGSVLQDGGLGADLLAASSVQDPIASITGDGSPWDSWPWILFKQMVDYWNYMRSRMIEEGYEGPLPPVIDLSPQNPLGGSMGPGPWIPAPTPPAPGGTFDAPLYLVPKFTFVMPPWSPSLRLMDQPYFGPPPSEPF